MSSTSDQTYKANRRRTLGDRTNIQDNDKDQKSPKEIKTVFTIIQEKIEIKDLTDDEETDYDDDEEADESVVETPRELIRDQELEYEKHLINQQLQERRQNKGQKEEKEGLDDDEDGLVKPVPILSIVVLDSYPCQIDRKVPQPVVHPNSSDDLNDEILNNLKEEEKKCKKSIDPDYFMRHTFTWTLRNKVVDWILEIQHQFQLFPETFFLAIHIMDRYLTVEDIQLEKLTLMGLASLLIAIKFEETAAPSLDFFVEVIAEKFIEREDLVKAEKQILLGLDFDLCYASPLQFVRFLTIHQQQVEVSDIMTRETAKYFIDISCVDHHFLGHVASEVAAGSLWLARRMFTQRNNETTRLRKEEMQIVDEWWDWKLVNRSGYKVKQLLPVVNKLLDFLVQVNEDYKQRNKKRMCTVYLKWSCPAHSEVSISVRDWMDAVYVNHSFITDTV